MGQREAININPLATGLEKIDPSLVFTNAMTFLVLLMSDMRNQVIGHWISI
ncbi:hypothetical protein Patl1_34226 [Pistacia atlantica]|uniref:Uncharacterized protein n=1 Tax=Pistacia atlantica TaxID=434234 RepID=A0ACC0ZSX6_9ROSI|nr:hypothetical protein Patl1_34226 [Pistacia atlantica]